MEKKSRAWAEINNKIPSLDVKNLRLTNRFLRPIIFPSATLPRADGVAIMLLFEPPLTRFWPPENAPAYETVCQIAACLPAVIQDTFDASLEAGKCLPDLHRNDHRANT